MVLWSLGWGHSSSLISSESVSGATVYSWAFTFGPSPSSKSLLTPASSLSKSTSSWFGAVSNACCASSLANSFCLCCSCSTAAYSRCLSASTKAGSGLSAFFSVKNLFAAKIPPILSSVFLFVLLVPPPIISYILLYLIISLTQSIYKCF